MVDGSFRSAHRYSSRSDLNRCLLALAFATIAVSIVAHVASFFGVVVIQNREWQKWLTWILFVSLMWVVARNRRGAGS
jgi:hypothetical protein